MGSFSRKWIVENSRSDRYVSVRHIAFLGVLATFLVILATFLVVLAGCATKIDFSMPGSRAHFLAISDKIYQKDGKRRHENAEKMAKIEKTDFGKKLKSATSDDIFCIFVKKAKFGEKHISCDFNNL